VQAGFALIWQISPSNRATWVVLGAEVGKRLEELWADGILTDKGAERLAGCVTDQGTLRLLPGVFHKLIIACRPPDSSLEIL